MSLNIRCRDTIYATFGLLVFGLLAANTTLAQRGGRPLYDPATEVTTKGVVEEVKKQDCQNCMGPGMGVHLLFRTDSETIEVHVGPSSFLQKKNYAFDKGDRLEVIGSRVKLAGTDVLLAREIKKGNLVMTLRDPRGVPEWSGGKRP